MRQSSWLCASRALLQALGNGWSVALFLFCVFSFAPYPGKAEDDVLDSVEAKLPYAEEIRQVKNRLRGRENDLGWVNTEFENLSDFGKSDLRLMRADYGRLMAQCQEAIAAYRRGDTNAARQLAKATERANPDRDWRRRREARTRQSTYWPTEDWVASLERHNLPRARAYSPVWVAARRRAAMAWADVAEAIVPGADPDSLFRLEDKAFAAEAEIQAHEHIWHLAEALDYRVSNKRYQSAELSAKLESFDKLRQEIMTICRERAEVERRTRQWQRTQQKLESEIAEAYRAAQQEYEAAQQRAKKK